MCRKLVIEFACGHQQTAPGSTLLCERWQSRVHSASEVLGDPWADECRSCLQAQLDAKKRLFQDHVKVLFDANNAARRDPSEANRAQEQLVESEHARLRAEYKALKKDSVERASEYEAWIENFRRDIWLRNAETLKRTGFGGNAVLYGLVMDDRAPGWYFDAHNKEKRRLTL